MVDTFDEQLRLQKEIDALRAAVDAAASASRAVQAMNPVLDGFCTSDDIKDWEASVASVEIPLARARIALSRVKIAFEQNEIVRAEQALKTFRATTPSGTLQMIEGAEFFIDDDCSYKAVVTKLRHYPRSNTYGAEVDVFCLSEESWVKEDTFHLPTTPGYTIEHKRFWPEIIGELRSLYYDEEEAELAHIDARDRGDYDDPEDDGDSVRQRGAEERAADHWRAS